MILVLLSCESSVPNENTLLDHRAKINIYNFKDNPVEVIYPARDFSKFMEMTNSKDTVIFTMKEFVDGNYIGATQHIIRFEMPELIELPKLISLDFELEYSITNSKEVHKINDIQSINYEFRRLDDLGWTTIDSAYVDTLKASILPIKLRATIDVYSARPEFDRNRSYENTAKLKITKFWLYGRH